MARMLTVESCSEPWHSGEADSAWKTILTLVLAPNPKLSKASRRVIELDYGMKNGEVSLQCRQALAFYVLRHLGLGNESSGQPETQQVVLKNPPEVNEHLPRADAPTSSG